MASVRLSDFREIWAHDFEFAAPPGERPIVRCLVAQELRSDRTIRLWLDGVGKVEPPYPLDSGCLFVAYNALAECSCHQALGWPLPARILDLNVEFKAKTNGIRKSGKGKSTLLACLLYHGLDGIDAVEKEEMRALAMRVGVHYTPQEQKDLIEYCETDVVALDKLLPVMMPELDLARAVDVRGRYIRALSPIDQRGIPIDVPLLERLQKNWDRIIDVLIASVDRRFGVYEGRNFKFSRWASWLAVRNIPWPRSPSGRLLTDDKTFRAYAKTNPDIALIRELRYTLGKLRLRDLAVGSDGRNRTTIWPFSSNSGRNQPSNSKHIFGPSVWFRGMIKPEEGMALAYVDWSQQEFGIGAALSRDNAMMAAYRSGDPYLEFGRMAGRIPRDGLSNKEAKKRYGSIRELFKQCVLAINYGMGAVSLAERIGLPVPYAEELIASHRRAFPRFWKWSDAVEDCAATRRILHTVFGWPRRIGPNFNPRSVRNFACQANGAEMLRTACILADERGVRVIATIHDALMVEAPVGQIDEMVEATRQLMSDASKMVLDGFHLETEFKVVKYPDRFMDEDRGRAFWEQLMEQLALAEQRVR